MSHAQRRVDRSLVLFVRSWLSVIQRAYGDKQHVCAYSVTSKPARQCDPRCSVPSRACCKAARFACISTRSTRQSNRARAKEAEREEVDSPRTRLWQISACSDRSVASSPATMNKENRPTMPSTAATTAAGEKAAISKIARPVRRH